MKTLLLTAIVSLSCNCFAQTNNSVITITNRFTATAAFVHDGWQDLTTNKYYLTNAKLFEAQHELEHGKSDDSRIPIDSVWVYVSYCPSESTNIPHFIGADRVIAVHGDWVEVISCHGFPSESNFNVGAMFYFDDKKSFLKQNHRIEPYVIK